MKTLFSIAILMLVCIASATSQTIPFQGVARNSDGVLIQNQNMAVRLSIHDGSPTGTTVYQETQSVSTNNLGLFTLNIGGGTAITGTFAGIAWSSGSKYIQIEVDPAGGTSYLNLGTTLLNSVPYALYAANSGGGSFTTPSVTRIPYAGHAGVISDGNFTRDSLTQKTQIICSPAGSNTFSYLNIDSTRATLGLFDANGYTNLLVAGHGGEFGFDNNTVAAVTVDGNNNVMHGLYAMKDSTELITTALDNNGNYSNSSYYGLVGTQAYSAYFDVLYNNGGSLNSLTLDSAGLHWEYNSNNQYTFPLTDGSSGQVISTDGAGHLTFTNLPSNTSNAHQILAGNGTAADTITVQNHKNNIYNPTTSITSLVVNLPGSPSDGDTFMVTYEASVSSISYLNGTVAAGVPTNTSGSVQRTFTYDAGTWY